MQKKTKKTAQNLIEFVGGDEQKLTIHFKNYASKDGQNLVIYCMTGFVKLLS